MLRQVQSGVPSWFVRWPARAGILSGHTEDELEPCLSLVSRLTSEELGVGTFRPFVLRLLGRWFEARHALTGELSNQAFQMLPHQVIVTHRVVNSAASQRKWLIADDVGLGKTIEAGMIMEVLRKRTLGRFRCLILTPAGLLRQWQEEMDRRFRRHFRLFEQRHINDLEQVDQLIASIDTLKSKKNAAALADVTPWDLVIVDEAHHIATDTRVDRHRLIRRLQEQGRVDNMLLLTATPHSGNVEHFYNMVRLLRPDLFTSKDDVTRGDGRLNQVMIRNRKSQVTDARGERIFKGILPAQILECSPSPEETSFYEELLRFVRRGYGVARVLRAGDKEQRSSGNAVGFLMATFRKLASSSREAIRAALLKRLNTLESGETASKSDDVDLRFEGEHEERSVSSLGTEDSKAKKKRRSQIEDEQGSLRKLLGLLEKIEHPDSKLTYFVGELGKLPEEDKGLIFTEYRGTQRALEDALSTRFGERAVVVVHGSMALQERQRQVDAFNTDPSVRFLISTEAGGEGLNMQSSCHVVFNYDLPWNPVRLQQRIGRVYRYGQRKPVRVYNVRLVSDSEAFADARVDEYLRRKIRDITCALAEVQGGEPEDIENDVLGRVAETMALDELYERAATEGYEEAKRTIDESGTQLQKILADPVGTLGLFKGLKAFDVTDYQAAAARVTDESLEYFVRHYLANCGEAYEADHDGFYSFRVPDAVKEFARRLTREDPYEVRREVSEARVQAGTVSKELARSTGRGRLLRFGDPVFEAMVRHVQDSQFSAGVASLRLAADALGWRPGARGTLSVFDLKVIRNEMESLSPRILRERLAAIVVPMDGDAAEAEHLMEHLHEVHPGDLDVDERQVDRAFELSQRNAEDALSKMLEDVKREYQTSDDLMPQIEPFALAWVEAV